MNASFPPESSMVDRVEALILARESGDITATEMEELDRLVREEPEARRIYARYVVETVDLQGWAACADFCGISFLETNTSFENPSAAVVDVSDASWEVRSSSTPIFCLLPSSVHSTSGYLSSGWPMAYLIATVVVGIGIAIAAITRVTEPMQQVVQSPSVVSPDRSPLPCLVGRITGMVDCVWSVGREDKLPSPACGRAGGEGGLNKSNILHSPIRLGDRLGISSGLLEITYTSGAKVILQGPVRYEVESAASGYLAVGKLTARLDHKATDAGTQISKSQIPNLKSPLFAIRTPTAVVTDLGTEFGVEVDNHGRTASHVFRGTVRVEMLSADGKPAVGGKILYANESASVEGNGENRRIVVLRTSSPSDLRDRDFVPSRFVREIPQPTVKMLDLADVVAGGNGFSGRKDCGIDPTNGRFCDKPLSSEDFILLGDSKYHRVPEMPFVDGVFIPDFRNGPVQVDSTGHRFEGYAWASGTPVCQTSGYIWAGGDIAIPASAKTAWTFSFAHIPVVLDGIDYSKSSHRVLCLHPNKGITFDLDAIRRANTDSNIVRFRAAAANVDTGVARTEGLADIWVLIDGRTCFQRRETGRSNAAFRVAVPISKSDRFLTLMTTDGGDGFNWDWVVFGDPWLELSAVQTKSAQESERLR